MFMKLGASSEPLSKSWAELRIWGSRQQRHWGRRGVVKKKKKDKHAQRFSFRVHYSAVPGEPELRRGVDSYRVKEKKKKTTLTESYPSSRCWHLHLNLLFLKGCRGRIVPLCVLCSHIGRGAKMCVMPVQREERRKKNILHYDISNLKKKPTLPAPVKN